MYIPSEKEIKINAIVPETVEEFLARGGKITSNRPKMKKINKIDAQVLLDAAIGTPYEKETIQFLASQGISVE